MGSPWGKFLAPITVPTGGWTIQLAYENPLRQIDHTVAAGTYDTILHVCKEVKDSLDASGEGGICTVSSSGYVTIIESDMVAIDFDDTDDAFETLLGFSGDETAMNNSITADNPHTHGWYPGIITYGSTRGEGLAEDSDWTPSDNSSSIVAGDGSFTSIGPDREQYTRTLTFALISRTEINHVSRGPKRLSDLHRHKSLYWYPDREDGIVGTYGMQGDPGPSTYHNDADLDAAGSYYWKVSQIEPPRFSRNQRGTPDDWSVVLTLNAEPA